MLRWVLVLLTDSCPPFIVVAFLCFLNPFYYAVNLLFIVVVFLSFLIPSFDFFFLIYAFDFLLLCCYCYLLLFSLWCDAWFVAREVFTLQIAGSTCYYH